MTIYNLSQWSQEAGNNNATSPAGAPEGWTGKEVNDTVRENMAVVRQWYDDPEWLSLLEDMSSRGPKVCSWVANNQFEIANVDAEHVDYFNTGRRIHFEPSGNEATVASVSAGAGNIVVTIVGTNVPVTIQDDGVWLYFSKTIDPSVFSPSVSVGDIRLTSGPVRDAAVDGWIPCDGAEYPWATYDQLATLYGANNNQNGGAYDLHPIDGNPQNNYFRVPDMRGRVPIGYWDTDDTANEPDGDYDNYPTNPGGADPTSTYYGEKEHTLLETEMPEHDHSFVSDGDHTHTLLSNDQQSASSGNERVQKLKENSNPLDSALPIANAGAHGHSFVAAGSGTPHENRQLSTVMGYLVFTGVG